MMNSLINSLRPKLDDIVKSNEDIKEEVKIKNAKPGSGLQVQEVVKNFKQID